MRGFAAIGMHNPKFNKNVGGVLRAAFCYNVALVAIQGKRYKRAVTDTTLTEKTLPVLQVNDLKDAIPRNCVPVAVDIIEGAQDLPKYKHPERAFYIFGAEDATLSGDIVKWCRDIVCVPTRKCMNLAVTVNVILYDRMCKQFCR